MAAAAAPGIASTAPAALGDVLTASAAPLFSFYFFPLPPSLRLFFHLFPLCLLVFFFSTSLMHSMSRSTRLALTCAWSLPLFFSPLTPKSQTVGGRLRAPVPPPRGGTGARPCGRLRGRRHPTSCPSPESPDAPGPLPTPHPLDGTLLHHGGPPPRCIWA